MTDHPDLIAHLKGELTDLERHQADEHVASCPDCRAETAALESTFRAVAEAPSVRPSAGFADRARARLLDRHPGLAAGDAVPEGRVVTVGMRLGDLWRAAFRATPAWAVSTGINLALLAAFTAFFLPRTAPPPPPRYLVTVAPASGDVPRGWTTVLDDGFGHVGAFPSGPGNLVLRIEPDGSVVLDGAAGTPEHARDTIRDLAGRHPDGAGGISVTVETGLPADAPAVRAVLRACDEAGVKSVRILRRP